MGSTVGHGGDGGAALVFAPVGRRFPFMQQGVEASGCVPKRPGQQDLRGEDLRIGAENGEARLPGVQPLAGVDASGGLGLRLVLQIDAEPGQGAPLPGPILLAVVAVQGRGHAQIPLVLTQGHHDVVKGILLQHILELAALGIAAVLFYRQIVLQFGIELLQIFQNVVDILVHKLELRRVFSDDAHAGHRPEEAPAHLAHAQHQHPDWAVPTGLIQGRGLHQVETGGAVAVQEPQLRTGQGIGIAEIVDEHGGRGGFGQQEQLPMLRLVHPKEQALLLGLIQEFRHPVEIFLAVFRQEIHAQGPKPQGEMMPEELDLAVGIAAEPQGLQLQQQIGAEILPTGPQEDEPGLFLPGDALGQHDGVVVQCGENVAFPGEQHRPGEPSAQQGEDRTGRHHRGEDTQDQCRATQPGIDRSQIQKCITVSLEDLKNDLEYCVQTVRECILSLQKTDCTHRYDAPSQQFRTDPFRITVCPRGKPHPKYQKQDGQRGKKQRHHISSSKVFVIFFIILQNLTKGKWKSPLF